MLTAQNKWRVADGTADESQLLVNQLDTAVGVPKSAVLVGGTVTVADTALKATSTILYNRSVLGGTPGHLSYAITAGTNVIFTSSSATDTSTLVYVVRY